MLPEIENRRDYVIARLAARRLQRTIRDLRTRLLRAADPMLYAAKTVELAAAESQLDAVCQQMHEWEMRGGCLSPPQPSP